MRKKDMIFVALLLVFHCFNLLSRRLKLLGVGDGTAHARNLRVVSKCLLLQCINRMLCLYDEFEFMMMC